MGVLIIFGVAAFLLLCAVFGDDYNTYENLTGDGEYSGWRKNEKNTD